MIKYKGFTLIELVLVIMVLGIISVGLIGFISIGSNIYKNVNYRDVLISDARFVIERLNREVRQSLPNSVRILDINGIQCMEFAPVELSTIYLDIPVSPEAPEDNLVVIKSSLQFEPLNSNLKRVVVYSENPQDAYDLNNGKAKALNAINTTSLPAETWLINLQNNSTFAADSPNERLYVVGQPVSFCIEGENLFRYQGYGFNTVQVIPNSTGQLMAEHVVANSSGFSFNQNNAMVYIDIVFNKNDEQIIFNNGIHITNVP